MSKPLPSPFPDMADAGQWEQPVKSKSGVPGFVFLSQPQGDSMRPSSRYYKPPSFHAANRGHQFPPHPARFGNGNGFRGSERSRSPFHNSRSSRGSDRSRSPFHNSGSTGRGNNSYAGNDSSYGNAHHGNSNRGNSYFEQKNSPIGNASSYGNNYFHSPRGNRSPTSFNSHRGNSSPFGYSSLSAGNFQAGPNASPAHSSLGGNSPFASPANANSSFQSSPFSSPGSRDHLGRGGRGQNSNFSGSNRRGGRGGRGGRNAPLSEVPAEKFMSVEILQNPWARLANSLDSKQKDLFLKEEEHEDSSAESPCSSVHSDSSSRQLESSDDTMRTSSSTVPSSSIEESNDIFADSWQ